MELPSSWMQIWITNLEERRRSQQIEWQRAQEEKQSIQDEKSKEWEERQKIRNEKSKEWEERQRIQRKEWEERQRIREQKSKEWEERQRIKNAEWEEKDPYLKRISVLMDTDMKSLKLSAGIQLWEDGRNYQQVVQFVNNSQCHENVKLTVVNIHRVWRREDDDRNLFHIENRMLLWHGTKRNNIPKILNTGFQLPNAAGLQVVHGSMFGPGIYFADRITKSSNYCDQDKTFLLLCEVGLGKVYSCRTSHNDWQCPPSGYDSVKGTGLYVPDWTCNGNYMGASIPFGKTAKCTKYLSHSLLYNEFIVYDPKRIIIKFLVEVEIQKASVCLADQLVIPVDSSGSNKTTMPSKKPPPQSSTSSSNKSFGDNGFTSFPRQITKTRGQKSSTDPNYYAFF